MLSVKDAYSRLRSFYSGFIGDEIVEGKEYYWFSTERYEPGDYGLCEEYKVHKKTGVVAKVEMLESLTTDDCNYEDRDDPPMYSLKEVLVEPDVKRGA